MPDPASVIHTPVLLQECLTALNPQPDRAYADLTLGGGGHAHALCQRLDATNTFVGIDQDPIALERARPRLEGAAPAVHLVQGNFGQLQSLLIGTGVPLLDGGVLMDLGVSDFQIKTPERGFSFQSAGPIDMRMSPDIPDYENADALVNTASWQSLAKIFKDFGEERLARPIAEEIVKRRPLTTTKELAQLAWDMYRRKGIAEQSIHPATRIFQALRMAVNDELGVLNRCLESLPKVLKPGARVAIITFHSLEDRTVKQYFRLASAECVCPPNLPACRCNHVPTFKLIGKPVFPTEEEIARNPQSRSAKLRIAERIAPPTREPGAV